MRLIALIFIVAIYGCSTSPSKYKESSGEDFDKEGYSDKAIDKDLRVATFMGNSSTKKESAELYAKFRAIEICYENKLPYAHILLIKDKTFEKQTTQTTTDYPSYYYGASPYYGRYGAYGAGYGAVTTRTWNETYTYPLYEVYFECADRPLDARMSFKVLSQSQVKDFVKDAKGAVQIEEVLPDSPNKDQLKVADIIIKANGTRVENILELYQANRSLTGKKFNIDFLREGVKKNVDVKFLDVTEMVAESQKQIIKEACKIKEIKDTRSICK